jgi:hypothetical protein
LSPAVPALVALLLVGCRMTPDEVRAIEVENDLLREQIVELKAQCQRRELELRPEVP